MITNSDLEGLELNMSAEDIAGLSSEPLEDSSAAWSTIATGSTLGTATGCASSFGSLSSFG
jgi:hypothetical protein